MVSTTNPRQLAFLALQNVYQKQAYTDIALDRVLTSVEISPLDRGLVCELVYGVVRRQRTLDALIDSLGKKKARQQPPNLRIILQLGLYQLRYVDRIPASAAVNTSVELAKANQLNQLAGVVNGILRAYIRKADQQEVLLPANDIIEKLGNLYSFPDWIIATWLEQLSIEETEQLAAWFNQPPKIDLRVNILQTTVAKVANALSAAGISVSPVDHLPQALRLSASAGAIETLPGYREGWWVVQDSSAQLVTHLLDPQPGETIIDACAAPGGKTTHIAELMGDKGRVIACDRNLKRLYKVQENAQRLQLRSIQIRQGDSRQLTELPLADRVLLDAPCSGLGTLHKRPDIRWRQNKSTIEELSAIQRELLKQAATWIEPQGVLVYATCTINPQENEKVIQSFLATHPEWKIKSPVIGDLWSQFINPEGWIKVYPHRYDMDGFFMVKLQKN